jgi:hypothetical protein
LRFLRNSRRVLQVEKNAASSLRRNAEYSNYISLQRAVLNQFTYAFYSNGEI